MERQRQLTPPPPVFRLGHAQNGMAMIIALIVLGAMALAAVALVRSVNTSSQITGNLSFRQDATANSDRVTQEAIAMLYSKLAADQDSLNNDLASDGYYASHPADLDATGSSRTGSRVLIKWDGDYCSTYSDASSCAHTPITSTATLTPGNAGAYIVFRMCRTAGAVDVTTTGCATTAASVSNTCQGAINYENEGKCPSGAGVTPFYRVLVRVTGPRNTASYTETIVHY